MIEIIPNRIPCEQKIDSYSLQWQMQLRQFQWNKKALRRTGKSITKANGTNLFSNNKIPVTISTIATTISK